jgi:hypothetical protein
LRTISNYANFPASIASGGIWILGYGEEVIIRNVAEDFNNWNPRD